eukprot:Skav211063  [mRNA]  locus=scaffold314:129393:143003:- [translate_table: standard]
MNDLEERIAVRYVEAKEFTEQFRNIQKTMNHKEQVQALDAAQNVLEKLEHVRQTDVIDDESLREVDESLAQLASLCDAKSLKSQFYEAGRRAVVMARLQGGEGEKRGTDLLRQAFKRAIKKASATRAVFGESKAHTWRTLTRPIWEEEDEEDELASPSARLLRELETSEYNFLTTSAEAKAVAKKELLMLDVQHLGDPMLDKEPGLPRVDSGPMSPARQKRQATITASYTLEDDFSWSTSPRGVAHGEESKAPKKPSLDRAALAAKKQMVRALMLEMHLRELSGQGPLPTLDSRSPASASMPVTLWDSPGSTQLKSPRVKTMPAISMGGRADPGSSATPQSWDSPSSSMSPASPSISPSMPSPPQASHPKGRLPDGSTNRPGDNPHPRRPNSLEGGTPQDTQDESPRHPQRVAVAKNLAPTFADSIRSAFGLPTSAPRKAVGRGVSQDCHRAVRRDALPGESASSDVVQEDVSQQLATPRSTAATGGGGDSAESTAMKSLQESHGMPSFPSRAGGGGDSAESTAMKSLQESHGMPSFPSRAGGGGDSAESTAMKSLQESHGMLSFLSRAGGDSAESTATKSLQESHGRLAAPLKSPGATRMRRPAASNALPARGSQNSQKGWRGKSLLDQGEADELTAPPSQAAKSAASMLQRENPNEAPAGAGLGKSTLGKHGDLGSLASERTANRSNSNKWRDNDAQVIQAKLNELDALVKAQKTQEAAFAAAAFLATVGLDTPQLLQWPTPGKSGTSGTGSTQKRIHSYEEMLQAKEKAQEILEEAESQLTKTDPAEIWEALDEMDCMLSFLEPVCIIEACFSNEPPIIEAVRRGSDYDWSAHANSLHRLKTTLQSSSQWTLLEESRSIQDNAMKSMKTSSLREYISRGEWLHEDFEDSDPLHDYSCSTSSSMQPRTDRVEWLKDSHQAIIPCRSRHVERKTHRITLERTVKERHHRGLRLYCVQPEMQDMWEDYCNLVSPAAFDRLLAEVAALRQRVSALEARLAELNLAEPEFEVVAPSATSTAAASPGLVLSSSGVSEERRQLAEGIGKWLRRCVIGAPRGPSAFKPEELLTVHGRAPRGNVACGVVIDDVLVAEQVVPESAPAYTEGERRLDLLCEEYLQKGLRPHPRKTFRKEAKVECWGASINGVTGIVRASPKRLIPLMWISSRICLLGFATVGLLQIVTGSWISVLQVRRRMLCLLEVLYAAQQGREQTDVVQLSPEAKSELWSLVALGPIAVTDISAQSVSDVYLSDASEECTASVRANTSKVFVKELQRHCLSRGTWSKLLSPWDCWKKTHGLLSEEDELPEGVPLVSHPLWLALAEILPFQLNHKRLVTSRKHINLLELQSVLEVETKLAAKQQDCRYVLGADSQVTLAVLVSSSSPALNTLMRKSLPTVLGNGIYGNYGFVPSNANVADDPTRDRPVRKPVKLPVFDLQASLGGNFSSLDGWLHRVGFSVEQVVGLPTLLKQQPNRSDLQEFLFDPLRSVQKPEKLVDFDAKRKIISPFFFADNAQKREEAECKIAAAAVSHPVSEGREIDQREHNQEPESQTKSLNKRPEKPSQAVSSASRVAPPREVLEGEKTKGSGSTGPSGPHRTARSRRRHGRWAEDVALPQLSAASMQWLSTLPRAQFLVNGRRAAPDFVPERQGFLDLYSGEAGVAKALSKRFGTWVLTFDFCHGERQNLLDSSLQQTLLAQLRLGTFWGVGAAPECASFSRAVNPPVRSRELPAGLPDLSERMALKVERGNQHGAFVLAVLKTALQADLAYWAENPDGSFLWLQEAWLESGLARFDASYRFDMCRYGAIWRKRTRICTNTELQGLRELCCGGHSHQQLRGRSLAHQMNWTRIAQVYPRKLCSRLAGALAKRAQLKQHSIQKFSVSACAKAGEGRIGEASHPGPPKRRKEPRNVADLLTAPIFEPTTIAIQQRVWHKFEVWLHDHLSESTCSQIFLCPLVAAQVLRMYGVQSYERGEALYELRHLLVYVQRQYPLLKPVLGPAWDIIARWEEIRPVHHRTPLPSLLFRAVFCVAVFKGWRRWAATLLLGYEGLARIGEVLAALRRDLVLPSDLFEAEHPAAFLRIHKPKSKRRGKGRIQHLKVETPAAVHFLEAVFCELDSFLPLFPLSTGMFRTRWEKILIFLGVPKAVRPTPASIRGGGAISAYRKGESIQSIMWRMRLVSQSTLESYLQELAAESFLTQLPESAKSRIRFFASFYFHALQSPG